VGVQFEVKGAKALFGDPGLDVRGRDVLAQAYLGPCMPVSGRVSQHGPDRTFPPN